MLYSFFAAFCCLCCAKCCSKSLFCFSRTVCFTLFHCKWFSFEEFSVLVLQDNCWSCYCSSLPKGKKTLLKMLQTKLFSIFFCDLAIMGEYSIITTFLLHHFFSSPLSEVGLILLSPSNLWKLIIDHKFMFRTWVWKRKGKFILGRACF